ncbi:MAG: hypothetical protein U0Q03_21520 [Acidimicrobiales bacterium]
MRRGHLDPPGRRIDDVRAARRVADEQRSVVGEEEGLCRDLVAEVDRLRERRRAATDVPQLEPVVVRRQREHGAGTVDRRVDGRIALVEVLDESGLVGERREERTSCLEVVVAFECLDREQGGEVESILSHTGRHRGQSPGLGGPLAIDRDAPLPEGEHSRRSEDDHQHGRAGEEHPQALVPASFGSDALGVFGLGTTCRGEARVEEVARHLVERTPGRGVDAELDQRLQPGTAIERGLVAPLVVPGRCARPELTEHPPSVAILGEPGAQARPRTEHGLVGHLDGGVVDRHEARPDQCGQCLLRVGVAGGQQLGDRHAVGGLDVGDGRPEPGEDVACGRTRGVGERRPGRLGGAGDGAAHAAGLRVGVACEQVAVAPQPGLAQCVREQRQGAGLAEDVVDDLVVEASLEPQRGRLRRHGDHPPELVVTRRAEQHMGSRQGVGEPWVRRARSVVVGPQGHHHAGAPRLGQ